MIIRFIISVLLLSIVSLMGLYPQENYSKMREEMVSKQIVERGISSRHVVRAMREVERHLFVPQDLWPLAYNDHPLPIGEGQTISQPYVVAHMTQLIRVNKDSKVLEIGTGSGYQAAILGEIVNELYTIEIIEPLYRRSSKLLDSLGYNNIYTKLGDGYQGWEEHAPYDAIIVTCAPTDIPEPLVEQLAEGGRMIIPVGARFTQSLVLLVKSNGKIRKRTVAPVLFVPMLKKDNERYQSSLLY